MPFSEEPRTYTETRTRTSSNYLKFSPDYRTRGRILDLTATQVWKHWLPMANGGKGFGVNCPNTSSEVRPCPVDKLVATLNDDVETEKALKSQIKARRRFVVNVLDRTPVTVCNSCDNVTPGKVCQFCKADLKKNEFHPLNEIKILEGGPDLFNKQLNPIESMMQDEKSVGIDAYDLLFMTQGVGRERQITVNPQEVVAIPDEDFLDTEGNPQKKFDLSLLAEPTSVEEIEMYLAGATIQQVNEARGVKA